MPGQRIPAEGSCRRHGNAVAVDKSVDPIGRRTASGAEEAIETVVERSALDPPRVVDAAHVLQSPAMNRQARQVAERQPDMPLPHGGGGVALLSEHAR